MENNPFDKYQVVWKAVGGKKVRKVFSKEEINEAFTLYQAGISTPDIKYIAIRGYIKGRGGWYVIKAKIKELNHV